jgi:hypothetical protein
VGPGGALGRVGKCFRRWLGGRLAAVNSVQLQAAARTPSRIGEYAAEQLGVQLLRFCFSYVLDDPWGHVAFLLSITRAQSRASSLVAVVKLVLVLNTAKNIFDSCDRTPLAGPLHQRSLA